MKVKPCPKKCIFNWKKFHGDLDVVMAHMIQELDGFYPSKAKLWDLVEYSFEKMEHSDRKSKTS